MGAAGLQRSKIVVEMPDYHQPDRQPSPKGLDWRQIGDGRCDCPSRDLSADPAIADDPTVRPSIAPCGGLPTWSAFWDPVRNAVTLSKRRCVSAEDRGVASDFINLSRIKDVP
jgi:hypothetical protein